MCRSLARNYHHWGNIGDVSLETSRFHWRPLDLRWRLPRFSLETTRLGVANKNWELKKKFGGLKRNVRGLKWKSWGLHSPMQIGSLKRNVWGLQLKSFGSPIVLPWWWLLFGDSPWNYHNHKWKKSICQKQLKQENSVAYCVYIRYRLKNVCIYIGMETKVGKPGYFDI